MWDSGNFISWYNACNIVYPLHRPVAGSSEHGTELSGSIKDGEFLEQLSPLSAPQDRHRCMELLSYIR
jgi:hypothetical protein